MQLIALGAAVIVVSVAFGMVVGIVSLRRRNRINPRVRTSAPLSWLWHPHGPARAHRRLVRALRGAGAALAQGASTGIAVGGLKDCLDELERTAISLDEHLVVASRFGPAVRRAMMRGLRSEVTEVEVLAARIAATVVARANLSEERLTDAIERITERLDALEVARAEVAQLEAAWHDTGLAPERHQERRR